MTATQSHIADLKVRLAASEAKAEKLREALEPFAKLLSVDFMELTKLDWHYCLIAATNIRRAVAILAETAPSAPDPGPQPDVRAAGMEKAARIMDRLAQQAQQDSLVADATDHDPKPYGIQQLLFEKGAIAIRAAIPAGASAADDGWCHDMGRAPRDKWLWTINAEDALVLPTVWDDRSSDDENDGYWRWFDADDSDSRNFTPVAWRLMERPLPPPPAPRAEGDADA